MNEILFELKEALSKSNVLRRIYFSLMNNNNAEFFRTIANALQPLKIVTKK